MNWLMKVVRYLFLVKEIVSKTGDVHFRRYRLIQTPWFALYIHHILKSDEDRDLHDHPWNFSSLILKGSYAEMWKKSPLFKVNRNQVYYPGDIVKHAAEDAHKITLMSKDVWTLVLVSGPRRPWGYRLKDGTWLSHQAYRYMKNHNMLDNIIFKSRHGRIWAEKE